MKTITMLGAVLAISAAATGYATAMPQPHDAGGPIKQGNYCWVYTSANGAGWWDRCDSRGRPVSLRGMREDEIQRIVSGGGDGGGAAGGSGGGGR